MRRCLDSHHPEKGFPRAEYLTYLCSSWKDGRVNSTTPSLDRRYVGLSPHVWNHSLSSFSMSKGVFVE
jgi:hypothetical protein